MPGNAAAGGAPAAPAAPATGAAGGAPAAPAAPATGAAGGAPAAPAAATVAPSTVLDTTITEKLRGRKPILSSLTERERALDVDAKASSRVKTRAAEGFGPVALGATAGAIAGSVVPVLGTVVGAAAGAAAGAAVGAGLYGGDRFLYGTIESYYAKRLNELAGEIPALEEKIKTLKDLDLANAQYNLAEKKLEAIKLENLRRKGKETGGDYHQATQDMLDKKAAYYAASFQDSFKVKLGNLRRKTFIEAAAARKEAEEHKIQMANSQIDKLTKARGELILAIGGADPSEQQLAEYKALAARLKQAFEMRESALDALHGLTIDESKKLQGKEKDLVAGGNARDNDAKTAAQKVIRQLNANAGLSVSGLASAKGSYDAEVNKLNAAIKSLTADPDQKNYQLKFEKKIPAQAPSKYEATDYEKWLIKRMLTENEKEVASGAQEQDPANPTQQRPVRDFATLSTEEFYQITKKYVRENAPKLREEYCKEGKKVEPNIQGRRGEYAVFTTSAGRVIQDFSGKKIKFQIQNEPSMKLRIPRQLSNGKIDPDHFDVVIIEKGKVVDYEISSDPKSKSRLDLEDLKKTVNKQQGQTTATTNDPSLSARPTAAHGVRGGRPRANSAPGLP